MSSDIKQKVNSTRPHLKIMALFATLAVVLVILISKVSWSIPNISHVNVGIPKVKWDNFDRGSSEITIDESSFRAMSIKGFNIQRANFDGESVVLSGRVSYPIFTPQFNAKFTPEIDGGTLRLRLIDSSIAGFNTGPWINKNLEATLNTYAEQALDGQKVQNLFIDNQKILVKLY